MTTVFPQFVDSLFVFSCLWELSLKMNTVMVWRSAKEITKYSRCYCSGFLPSLDVFESSVFRMWPAIFKACEVGGGASAVKLKSPKFPNFDYFENNYGCQIALKKRCVPHMVVIYQNWSLNFEGDFFKSSLILEWRVCKTVFKSSWILEWRVCRNPALDK